MVAFASAASGQSPSAPRPPAIEEAPAYEVSLGLTLYRWEADRIGEGAGPALALRRVVFRESFVGLRLSSMASEVTSSAGALDSRLYLAMVEVGIAPTFVLTSALDLQPGVHGAIGTAITDPDADADANRSQNTLAAGVTLALVLGGRWSGLIGYQRVSIDLEDPAATGPSQAIGTHADAWSLRLGFRF